MLFANVTTERNRDTCGIQNGVRPDQALLPVKEHRVKDYNCFNKDVSDHFGCTYDAMMSLNPTSVTRREELKFR